MNLTYEKCGDYLIPNLIHDPEPDGELRKFGLMRKQYLKENKSGIYRGDDSKWETKGTSAHGAGAGRITV
ncbi:MAG: TnpV protein [Blautia faecis]